MKVITSLEVLIAAKLSEDLTRKWSIHRLSKEMKKQYKPIYFAVQRLLKDGFLEKDRNGLINASLKNTFLLETAERYRFSCMKNKEVLIVINRIREKIKSGFFVAVLFGSSVKGTGRDIDVLCIIPDKESIEEFQKSAETSLGSIMQKVDLQCVNEKSCYEMLNKPHELNVMNEILKNHLVLQGGESFYRILRGWSS